MVFRDTDHLQVTLNIDDTIIIEQVNNFNYRTLNITGLTE